MKSLVMRILWLMLRVMLGLLGLGGLRGRVWGGMGVRLGVVGWGLKLRRKRVI